MPPAHRVPVVNTCANELHAESHGNRDLQCRRVAARRAPDRRHQLGRRTGSEDSIGGIGHRVASATRGIAAAGVTVLFTLSGNAIWVTLRDTPLTVTSAWMCVASLIPAGIDRRERDFAVVFWLIDQPLRVVDSAAMTAVRETARL